MEANYVHKDSTTLVQDELVKNELNQIELQYNALKQQKFNELLKENQELKKQLEVSNELVAQGTLTEMKLRNEFNRRRKEYQDTYKDVRIEIKEYKTQQKEFIKWLEKKEKRFDMIGDPINSGACCGILQKYKKIIGDINDKK